MKQDELKTKVFEALGQASMCWSETPKGIFDDKQAVNIGNELMDFINHLLSKQVVQSEVSEEIEYWKSENSRLVKQLENQKKTIRNYQEVVHVHFPEIYADSENLNDEIDRLKIELNILKSYHSKTLTPPDAEAVMFAEWIYKNYISNGIGKYYHNNWNGDLDTLVNYTTQELFTLYKQGGK